MTDAINVRNIKFDLDDAPRCWFGDNAGVTAFYDSLSALFPQGERAFIRAVLRVRDEIDDRGLLEAMDGFKGQEAIHAREHENYNRRLRALGYDIDGLEAAQAKTIDWTENTLGRYRNLAVTACLEHFTSILSSQITSDADYLKDAHPALRNFWTWHATEEIEHRAVAFDILQAVRPGYFFRCSMMLLTSWIFLRQIGGSLSSILKAENKRTFQTLGALANFLYGRPGLARRMALPLLTFFRPGFHPNAMSVCGNFPTLQARYDEQSRQG